VQVFPAALAVAEKQHVSGRDLLTAVVVGYEIALLAGRCWHDHHSTYHSCGSWGSVACAAVASRLMGLDLNQTKEALGIADYHAPNVPMMRDVDHPGMVKHGIGWGAMNGLVSAELAQRGFTGVPSLLGFEKYSQWVSDLGDPFLMGDGIHHKRWCSCGWGHPAIAAMETLVREHNLTADQIAGVTVYTFHQAWRLHRGLPESTEEAQFSVKWPLAAYLIDGVIGPKQITGGYLKDIRTAELAGRIEIVEDPEINRRFQLAHFGVDSPEAAWLSRVEVTLRDGRHLDSGDVSEQLEWDEKRFNEKLRWLVGHVLDEESVENLVLALRDIEDIPKIDELVRLVAGNPQS
jgi:2-methylcitrate dehydratase PrpD